MYGRKKELQGRRRGLCPSPRSNLGMDTVEGPQLAESGFTPVGGNTYHTRRTQNQSSLHIPVCSTFNIIPVSTSLNVGEGDVPFWKRAYTGLFS